MLARSRSVIASVVALASIGPALTAMAQAQPFPPVQLPTPRAQLQSPEPPSSPFFVGPPQPTLSAPASAAVTIRARARDGETEGRVRHDRDPGKPEGRSEVRDTSGADGRPAATVDSSAAAVHGSEAYDPHRIARDLQIAFRCPFLLGRREPRY